MAKLVLVCGVRLAAGAWQLGEERREFGTGTSLRAASTLGRAQCPAPRHGRPGRGVRLPPDTPFIQHPQETRSGLLSPTLTLLTGQRLRTGSPYAVPGAFMDRK